MSKEIDLNNKTVVVSRTDSIGDVVLTLPLCGWLKENFPSCKIIFLGRNYTKPILACYPLIDEIRTWDEIQQLPVQERVTTVKEMKASVFIHVFPNKDIAKIVKKAKIPIRIGTSHRSFHLLTCNYRPNFTRKNAKEHESQLNFHLLKPFGVQKLPSLKAINKWASWFNAPENLPTSINNLLISSTKKIVLHPKSQGSALEWPLECYNELAMKLIEKGYEVFYSGTKEDGKSIKNKIPSAKNVHDITGKMNLTDFIAFLDKIDGIVACSTGPLHIASLLNKVSVGLYPSIRPMHPERWKPIGNNVKILTDNSCSKGQQLKIDVEKVNQLFS